MDALLTLSSKGQLVIPARLRQLLGLHPGDRLELSLEADGLLLRPHGSRKTTSAHALIGCTGYSGPPIPLEQQDPALYASQALAWHHQGIDFADALHLLRSEGCARFATLDRALARAANALDLKPAVQPL